MKDSAAIKLFGMTIILPYDNLNNNSKLVSENSESEHSQRQTSSASSVSSTHTKDIILSVTKHNSCFSTNTEETLTEATTSSEIEEPSESSTVTEEEKTTLKKPDKLLPCPRCNSMDTKFCYFNNYNVNQPRHFCKKCQRYWTAGGTMRNVPVGSGRRKNDKDIISESINRMQSSSSSSLNTNGFLMFGSEKSIPSNSPRFGFPTTLLYCNGPWAGPNPSPPIYSTLGKHSREGIMITPSQTGKQNRIDDPSEAAKRSRSLFAGFVWTRDRTNNVHNATLLNKKNPAALARSLNFCESAQ